jgi:hypothetical protein
MKGLVFTEFVEFVEKAHGLEIADRMIETSDLPSAGVYTAVGTYDHKEMVTLLGSLTGITGADVPALLKAFGAHLLTRFVAAYPSYFEQADSLFPFLRSVHGHIHVEVRKLYSDAELPSFTYEQPSANVLHMTYSSARGLPDLAEGLINGAIAYYGETVDVAREDGNPDAHATLFKLTRHAA